MKKEYYNNKWRAPFPKRNADMTFQVLLKLKVNTDDPANFVNKVNGWITEEWIPNIHVWENVAPKEYRQLTPDRLYKNDFSAPPCAISCDNESVSILFRGQKTDYYWKDWVIMIFMPDIQKKFKEIIGFKSLKDYEE